MTENLCDTTVGVADLLPLFQCPDWLSVRLDPELSRDGRHLSEIFVRAFALILGRRQPRRAAVSCVNVGGALHVMFDFSPRRGDLEHSVIASLAEALQELHNRRFAAEIRDAKPQAVDGCRTSISPLSRATSTCWDWSRDRDSAPLSTSSSSPRTPSSLNSGSKGVTVRPAAESRRPWSVLRSVVSAG